jgi:hypothetical protein
LLSVSDFPSIAKEIKNCPNICLASDYKMENDHSLHGDIEALNLIDLDKEGLGSYKKYLKRNSLTSQRASTSLSK